MARSATTLDAFSAVAEPRRRQVLGVIGGGEIAVNDLVLRLGWPQPQVSKHLGVLRQVGLVKVRTEGRQRLYAVNGDELKPIHDWVCSFERLWDHQLDRIKKLAESKAKSATQTSNPQPKEK